MSLESAVFPQEKPIIEALKSLINEYHPSERRRFNSFQIMKLKRIGNESAISRVYRLNRKYIAKISYITDGNRPFHENNLATCQRLEQLDVVKVINSNPEFAWIAFAPTVNRKTTNMFNNTGTYSVSFEPLLVGESFQDMIMNAQLFNGDGSINGDVLKTLLRYLQMIRTTLSFLWNYPGFEGSGKLCFYHGDLHMGNIMIVNDRPYIIDFDWAGFKDMDSHMKPLYSSITPIPLSQKIHESVMHKVMSLKNMHLHWFYVHNTYQKNYIDMATLINHIHFVIVSNFNLTPEDEKYKLLAKAFKPFNLFNSDEDDITYYKTYWNVETS